jgi:hypothetical protein
MDLPDDAIGKIVDKWDVSDYVPFDPSHVQMNVSDGDNGDDDETREAKRAQLLVIKKAQYEALTEATIHENAQALNAFRATCSKFCDEYRAKARALQIKLWIQKGPAVAGGGRLRLRPGVANSGLPRLRQCKIGAQGVVRLQTRVDLDVRRGLHVL